MNEKENSISKNIKQFESTEILDEYLEDILGVIAKYDELSAKCKGSGDNPLQCVVDGIQGIVGQYLLIKSQRKREFKECAEKLSSHLEKINELDKKRKDIEIKFREGGREDGAFKENGAAYNDPEYKEFMKEFKEELDLIRKTIVELK